MYVTSIRGEVHGAKVERERRPGHDLAGRDCVRAEPYTCGQSNAADGWTLRGQIQLGRLLLLNIGQHVNDIQQSISRSDLLAAFAT